jgi:hypothetical protein
MQGFKITWWTYRLQVEVSERATSPSIGVYPLSRFSETSTSAFELRNLEESLIPFGGLRKESNAGTTVS